jgi:hypothetical protein
VLGLASVLAPALASVLVPVLALMELVEAALGLARPDV